MSDWPWRSRALSEGFFRLGLPDAEIPSARIGEMVMDGLRQIDSVAYLRFASVYRDFGEAKDFEEFASSVRDVGQD